MRKIFSFSMLALAAVVCVLSVIGYTDAASGIMCAGLLAFAIPESEMTPEQKALIGTIEQKFNAAMEQFKSGVMTSEQVKEALKSVGEEIDYKLKAFANFGDIEKGFKEQADKIQALAEAFDKIKQDGGMLTSVNAVEKAVGEFMETPKYMEYVNNRSKSSGTFELSLKGITSVQNNSNTPYSNNRVTGKVVTDVNEMRLNMRDLMTVDAGDPEALTVSWERVYDFDRNVTFVSENGMLEESTLKFAEETAHVKRVGTHMNLSKRLLKSKTYLVSFILNRLPSWVKMAENYQILFGDGQGDNLKGITQYDGVDCVSKFLTAGYVDLAAGEIKSVEANGEKNQVIVTLKDANDKIYDAAKVTIAGATQNASLNGTHDVHKMNDRQFAIEIANAKDETSASGISAKFFNGLYHSIADPNSGDVLNAIIAILTFGQYNPKAIVLNPMTAFALTTEKDTSGRPLNLVETRGGQKYIGSTPIIEYSGMPVGYYFAGDLQNGASLIDYTNLTIEFADDVNTKLKNMTCVIAQEEIQMPVYMPFSFAYGKLADVLAAISKP